MSAISRFRSHPWLSHLLTALVFFTSLWGIVLLVMRAYEGPDPFDGLISTSFYYTTQSNVLVFLTMVFFVTELRHKPFFRYVAFIALFDIVVTGVIFHVLLVPYMNEMGLMQHVLHTFTPILYIIFYLLVVDSTVSIKTSFVTLIHPLLYMSFVFMVVVPLFSDLMIKTNDGAEGAPYLYPFMNPANFENGVLGMMLFTLGLLAPLFVILAILLQQLKIKTNPL
jgi:hypothetical protein